MQQREAVLAKIDHLILVPLKGRGQPPKGWTPEAMAEDYYFQLAKFPEEALEKGFRDVMENRRFSTWPLASEINQAVRRYAADPEKPAQRDHAVDASVAIRSKRGWDYVQARLLADDGKLLLRLIRLGPWAKNHMREFLFRKACESLRAGSEPYCSNSDLEAEIASIEEEAEVRQKAMAQFTDGRKTLKASPPIRAYRVANPKTAPLVEMPCGPAPEVPEEPPMPTSQAEYFDGVPDGDPVDQPEEIEL